MTPELDQRLRSLGDIDFCPNMHDLAEDEYSARWIATDAALTGWGVRPPSIEAIDSASRLKIVCHAAGSVRKLPRRLLEKGVIVTTARAAIARTVAEFCLMNALILLRRQIAHIDPTRRGFYGDQPDSETLFGKTVGLIGYGVVGQAFHDLLRPFSCRILVHDPFFPHRIDGLELTDLGRLLSESKIISLHAPEIPETRGMIGARELALIPDTALFLNSARGRLVDTEALTQELQTGRLFAAIDVTDPEPLPADHPLRALRNVLFTPHVAGPTTDELPRLAEFAIDELTRFAAGQQPLHPMTLESYDRMSF